MRLTGHVIPAGYPYAVNNLGDHLKKRRLDLGLQLKQAAGLLGCQATSVANWEKGKTAPGTAHWPNVLEFLGYDPRPKEESLGEQLKRHRESRGWSQTDLATTLGVSVSVLWRWESGQRKPKGKYLTKVHAFLGNDPRPVPVTIGERLRRHRERLAVTLTAMAKLLGVALSTLCRWEAGEREPAGAHLARVEAVLVLMADGDRESGEKPA